MKVIKDLYQKCKNSLPFIIVFMLCLGTATAYGGKSIFGKHLYFLNEKKVTATVSDATPNEAEKMTAQLPYVLKDVEMIPAENEVKAETEAPWEPSAASFNLVHIFPEGADETDPLQSYGGEAFRIIFTMDIDWYSNIFNSLDMKPVDMAARLGVDKSQIIGKYDITDSSHYYDNPESWTVNKWTKISTEIRDPNSNLVNDSSNAKEILAMACVYGYYHDWTDYDSFLDYSKSLWNKTHSFRFSMGNVYYDNGCISEDKKKLSIEKGNGKTTTQASVQTETESISVATVSEAEVESNTKPYIYSHKKTESPLEAYSEAESTESSLETTEEESDASESSPESEPDSETQNETLALDKYPVCPGHLDLKIKATVYGLDGKKNLFTADKTGNDKKNFNDRWQGWTPDHIEEVRTLVESDWYELYGLSINDFSKRAPLSEEEIKNYIDDLPDDISDQRKKIIDFALHSVGNVPYYFGGKASYPGYDKNNFFTPITPDYKGRVQKGLDCSGWVNWVYWSVTGVKDASSGGTSGLAANGHSVQRNGLKPGDVVVRPGNEETIGHAVIFLSWSDDGKMNCIHETGGTINNVTIGNIEGNWNYRNLLD